MERSIAMKCTSRKKFFDRIKCAEFDHSFWWDPQHKKTDSFDIVTEDRESEISATWMVRTSVSDKLCKWEEIILQECEKKIYGNLCMYVKKLAGNDVTINTSFDSNSLPFKQSLSSDEIHCESVEFVQIKIQIYLEDEIEIIKFFENEKPRVVTFVVQGREFSADKNSLVSRSEVFAAMFDADMLEKKTGRVDIKEVESRIFKKLLDYICLDKFECNDTDDLLKLLVVANRYSVKNLESLCAYHLCDKISERNVMNIIKTADLVKEKILSKNCKKFLALKVTTLLQKKHFADISKSFQDLQNFFEASVKLSENGLLDEK